MIDMALLSVLRRWNFRDGMPIREIARRTELSCNTLRKYLACSEQEPLYRRSKFPSKLSDYEQAATS
jgi:transposase